MSVDRISNMLSSIKNSVMAGRDAIEVPHSNECENIAKVLKGAKFLSEVKVFKPSDSSSKMLHIEMAKNDSGLYAITDVKRVSKPGRRIYRKYAEFKKVKEGFGVAVVSTSRGVMSGDDARKKKLGGEILCEVF